MKVLKMFPGGPLWPPGHPIITTDPYQPVLEELFPMIYQVETTTNMPEGECYDTFISVPFKAISEYLHIQYPTLTSFVMVCTPIKED